MLGIVASQLFVNDPGFTILAEGAVERSRWCHAAAWGATKYTFSSLLFRSRVSQSIDTDLHGLEMMERNGYSMLSTFPANIGIPSFDALLLTWTPRPKTVRWTAHTRRVGILEDFLVIQYAHVQCDFGQFQ